TEAYRAIQAAEAILEPLARGQVRLEMAVVEGQADKVESLFGEQGDICFGDIALHVRIEKCGVRLFTEHAAELLADFPFGPRQADHVILNEHPAAEIHAA